MLNSNELGQLSDRELLAESRAYEVKLTGNAAGLNFTSAEVSAINRENDTFEAQLDAWDAAQLAEDQAAEAKKGGRQSVLDEIRRQRNISYADTTVSDETRAGYGLPPRDKTKTTTAAPATAPLGHIDYGKLKHTIHFRDAATPDKKAKPKGMKGCDIYRAIGAPPTSEDDYRYVTNDSDSPHVMFYEMADAGKRVYYLLRWVSNLGETGEWSETIEATING
jgi:hypothetical protein